MKKLDNPLDTLFNVEPSDKTYTPVTMTEGDLAALQAPTSAPEVDAEDQAIDQKIDTVYDSAMETFQNQMNFVEILEPRYAARNAEVAATFLNIALNAAATRARVRGDRRRNTTFVPFNNPSNRAITASREDILKMLSVDGEIKDIK